MYTVSVYGLFLLFFLSVTHTSAFGLKNNLTLVCNPSYLDEHTQTHPESSRGGGGGELKLTHSHHFEDTLPDLPTYTHTHNMQHSFLRSLLLLLSLYGTYI